MWLRPCKFFAYPCGNSQGLQTPSKDFCTSRYSMNSSGTTEITNYCLWAQRVHRYSPHTTLSGLDPFILITSLLSPKSWNPSSRNASSVQSYLEKKRKIHLHCRKTPNQTKPNPSQLNPLPLSFPASFHAWICWKESKEESYLSSSLKQLSIYSHFFLRANKLD